MKRPFTATVWREGNWYVSQCFELDIASQGETVEEALASSRRRPHAHRGCARSRLRPGCLKPQPFHEVERRLGAIGFVEAGQKGSHVKYVRRMGDTVDTAIVPRNGEIPIGPLRSILSQAHINLGEWDHLV